jgi:uncharacterized membrane protein
VLGGRSSVQTLIALLILLAGGQALAQEESESFQGQMSHTTGSTNRVSISSRSSITSSASATMSPGYDSFSSSRIDISPTDLGVSRIQVGITEGASLNSNFGSTSLDGDLSTASSTSDQSPRETTGSVSATGVVGDAEIRMNEGTSFSTTTTPRGYTYDSAASALKGTPVFSCQSERCQYQSQNIAPDEFKEELQNTAEQAAIASANQANIEAENAVQTALNTFAQDLLDAQDSSGSLVVIEEANAAESDYETLKANYRSLAQSVLGASASESLVDQAVATEFGEEWNAESAYPVVTILDSDQTSTLTDDAILNAKVVYASHIGQIAYQNIYQQTFPDAYRLAYQTAYDDAYRGQVDQWLTQDKAIVYDRQNGSGNAGSVVSTGMDTSMSQTQFTQVFIQAFR